MLNLYGLDINELNPWRSLVHHVDEQVGLGRPVLVELDSFFLPDTRGTAYKIAHVKSTVAVNEIDIEARHMGYFHGQGYYHLEGDDFADIFQIGGLVHDRMLPPYIEYVNPRWTGPCPGGGRELRRGARSAACAPSSAFSRGPTLRRSSSARFEHDLEWLMDEPIDTFHAYSFATLRQYGACYELCETYLRWLAEGGEADLDGPTEAFREISATAKAFQFQLARAMARKRELPLDPFDAMGALWEPAIEPLVERYG